MSQPVFSIIVPIYNTPKEYLDQCIESLIAQTYAEYEIILVDDGSEPLCREKCDAYAAKNERIRVIHQENQGVSAARNNGILAAQAEWVMFVDADDWLDLDGCLRIKERLDCCECDILMFNGIKEYADRTEVLHAEFEDRKRYFTADLATKEWFYRKAMRPKKATGAHSSQLGYSWDKVYNREFLIKNDLQFPVGISKSEDKIFVLKCFERMKALCYIDDKLYHYRQNSGSVCYRFSDSADQDRKKMAIYLYEIAKRMNEELAELKKQPDYDWIMKDYYRFLFGIISDVLALKFFHPDNPAEKKERITEAKAFVWSEPFKTALQFCKYKELSTEAKLKKAFLKYGLVSEFYAIWTLYQKIRKGHKATQA